jgi:four helix bundle protein
MGARRIEDLIVWQLANQLRDKTYELMQTSARPLDLKFRSQIEDALSSVTRNIGEGFGRYYHKEFARYLSYARGSICEVGECLKDGIPRRYWSKEAMEPAAVLCERTLEASTKFINYLRNNPDP